MFEKKLSEVHAFENQLIFASSHVIYCKLSDRRRVIQITSEKRPSMYYVSGTLIVPLLEDS